jgi:hypothetical protein
MRIWPTAAILITFAQTASGQAPDPRVIFAPLQLPNPPGATRSAGGIPGPGYWQNRADYTIAARIDPAIKMLTATETITYTNNSPDALDILWVQLDQNIYRRDARAAFKPQYKRNLCCDVTDGDVIDSIGIDVKGKVTPVPMLVTDTRMQIRLPTPLAPKGGQIKLHITYHYTIPGAWGGRTAVTDSKNGPIYEIAQWFPRMAVYDDLRGWDTAPYLGSEFYLEYGNIEYSVTVPWDYIVEGSGELLNPQDVLTPLQRARLTQAAGSDKTIYIRTPDEIGKPESRPAHAGDLTWRFRMKNTRDTAFAASPAFVWDAARINLPNNAHALAMSIYPVEAVGKQAWDRSTGYVKSAIENFSKRWFVYPWPQMVNLGGHGAGMEYPGIVFDDMHDTGKDLFWITTHEVGHSWFPMIVGSNERRDAFMDEGFNTFIDVYQSDDFNHGEFGPKRDSEYAGAGGNPVDDILPILADPDAPAIVAPADIVSEKYRHAMLYFKPALGLVLLREQVLGPDRFDQAFRKYIAAWAYKHPSPSDFFRAMASQAGEDLSWWWRGWYLENDTLDIDIVKASYPGGAAGNGLHVELANHGRLVMPVTLDVAFHDGGHDRVTVPVEAWMHGNEASFDLATNKPVDKITLDPERRLPLSERNGTTSGITGNGSK